MTGWRAGIALAALLGAVPGFGAAQSLRDCDTWEANARNIMLPAGPHIRSYANGAIHLLGLDTEEPACCAFHLMVLAADPEGGQSCTLISREGTAGFAALSMAETAASYDPARGLTLRVPVYIYLPEQSFGNSGLVSITVNQATGTVAADFTPGPRE